MQTVYSSRLVSEDNTFHDLANTFRRSGRPNIFGAKQGQKHARPTAELLSPLVHLCHGGAGLPNQLS